MEKTLFATMDAEDSTSNDNTPTQNAGHESCNVTTRTTKKKQNAGRPYKNIENAVLVQRVSKLYDRSMNLRKRSQVLRDKRRSFEREMKYREVDGL